MPAQRLATRAPPTAGPIQTSAPSWSCCMATSRSPEWNARALLFSGRPDPTWPVPESVVNELYALWSALGPRSGAPPAAPLLGYRGCVLRAPDGREWRAFGGAVTLTTPEGVDVRSDA